MATLVLLARQVFEFQGGSSHWPHLCPFGEHWQERLPSPHHTRQPFANLQNMIRTIQGKHYMTQ
eukprot:5914522-Amphidinium_carterae.1